jgi:hypothetical protein
MNDDGMMWLFFKKRSKFDLAAAAAILKAKGFKTKKKGKRVLACAPPSAIDERSEESRVGASSVGAPKVINSALRQMGDDEVAELRAMAGNSEPGHRAKLRACDAGIEISFDDRKSVLDEMNALIETQLTLREASKGWLYLGWSCVVQAPD